MFGFDPRFVLIFCVGFIGLGIFNFVLGRRRQLAARARGQRAPWYTQLGILTGIEYTLLALVLLLHLGIISNVFPQNLAGVVVPIYVVVMGLSALVLCVMLYQGLTASRKAKPAQVAMANQGTLVEEEEEEEGPKELSAEQRAAQAQKRRERRQKAADARRRRMGRA